ncbi:hypothetical protein [Micromonospora sp. WMMD1082]|uniref:hypothetical protein n=1 Tax=Micromonospora sp. WMMD1082 TaxID=3016104 RepID=UPI002416B164|nr:hypothetical protein [Micromonospora sp. WMMD1082]MDG4798914.1 hypothetical protein [Micromonospora sp. WMMD1082]
MTRLLAAELDIAQTATITSAALAVALAAVVGFVSLGFYRARRSTAGEAAYHALVERVVDAETRSAEATAAALEELTGLRAEVRGARDEMTEVKRRLAELERLLSQIG